MKLITKHDIGVITRSWNNWLEANLGRVSMTINCVFCSIRVVFRPEVQNQVLERQRVFLQATSSNDLDGIAKRC